MSDTDMTLDEAVKFLNTKLGKRGRPSKEYSAKKERAVAIVNAATESVKVNLTAIKSSVVAATAAKTNTVTASAVPIAPTVPVVKTPEEVAKSNAAIDDALATLGPSPGGDW